MKRNAIAQVVQQVVPTRELAQWRQRYQREGHLVDVIQRRSDVTEIMVHIRKRRAEHTPSSMRQPIWRNIR